jgi:hypothetical protein
VVNFKNWLQELSKQRWDIWLNNTIPEVKESDTTVEHDKSEIIYKDISVQSEENFNSIYHEKKYDFTKSLNHRSVTIDDVKRNMNFRPTPQCNSRAVSADLPKKPDLKYIKNLKEKPNWWCTCTNEQTVAFVNNDLSQIAQKYHQQSPLKPSIDLNDKENNPVNQQIVQELTIERKKWQSRIARVKKALKGQVSELRTEIARREIKHQEELLSSKKTQEPKISKEIKFIIDSHKSEIESLKINLVDTKLELNKKSIELASIHGDRLKQTNNINYNADYKFNELKNNNQYLQDQISVIEVKHSRDIQIIKNQHK